MGKEIWRVFKDILWIICSSIVSAIALHTFVNPANFAPSGVDGIAMMTQKLFGINMGYITFAINIPLLIIAWFFINKRYVIYTALFTTMTSYMLILMERINMYEYVTESNAWIAVFASGIMLGARAAVMIKIGGSTGGVAIIATMVQKKRPYMNIETLISSFSYVTIALSFFVYGNIESVIMAIVQMMVFNIAMDAILKSSRNAVEVRIITDKPEEFKEDILNNLRHGATILDGHGMFTDTEKAMIVTIINIRQMNDLIKLAQKHPDSFVYFSDVNGVWGNFRWKKVLPLEKEKKKW